MKDSRTMRLRSLTLSDFGTVRGEQSLDLAPREKYGKNRPVVLIGGQNGAGKTTILEAVRLCLYGRLALGPRISDVDYKRYLRDRIHRDRNALIHADSAFISLSFDHARAGHRTVYTVERRWRAVGKSSVHEDVSLLKNGHPLTDVESHHWESFVRSLVPYGLSQFFFFDGERIQRLAEDGADTAGLAESVKSMLGLDLVEQLHVDLGLFERKHLMRSPARKDARTRLKVLASEMETLEAESEDLCQRAANTVASIHGIESEITRSEEELSQRGKGLADARDRLRGSVRELELHGSENERRLRELLEGAAPLALCRELCDRTLRQLDSEEAHSRARFTRSELDTALTAVRDHLMKPAFLRRLGLTPEGKQAFADELARVQNDVLLPLQAAEQASVLHGLSEYDAGRCREQVREGLRAGEEAKRLSAEILRLEEERRGLATHLGKAPVEEDLAPVVQRLQLLGEQKGRLQAALEQFESSRQAILTRIERNKREQERLIEDMKKEGQWNAKLDLAARVRTTLAVYLEQLTQQKLVELQNLATESFQRLCRKNDLVRRMVIDPTSFRVTLLDGHDRVLQKEDLSAGEKQIYAISILWALSRVAGRPLPMIIDTPLGRLDSQHRRRLVEDYFPYASHQVIILSTDTEIDEGFVKALKPHLSHTIHLVYHEDEGWTEATSGYFWT
ncbi:MAG: DNA sulfur modification protein DndD [Nannocystaceae bacterium]